MWMAAAGVELRKHEGPRSHGSGDVRCGGFRRRPHQLAEAHAVSCRDPVSVRGGVETAGSLQAASDPEWLNLPAARERAPPRGGVGESPCEVWRELIKQPANLFGGPVKRRIEWALGTAQTMVAI